MQDLAEYPSVYDCDGGDDLLDGGPFDDGPRKTKRLPSFWLSDTENGDVAGIDNLPAALTINGTTVLPTFRYRGGDADGTDWDAWTYGETLTAAGSGGSFDQGTPWWGDSDYSVDPAGTRYWQASGNTFADVTTEDLVFELVLAYSSTANVRVFGKWGSSRYAVYSTGTGIAAYLYDGTNLGLTVSDALVDGHWYHMMFFGDRSGSGQIYIDAAASGAAVDISAVGSLTVAAALTLADDSTPGNQYDQRIAYAAMYQRAGWLDTHLQATVAAERFQRLCGLWPKRALGTKAYSVYTRATTAVSDKVERGANLCTAPYDFSDAAWTATRVDTPTAGGVATPEGRHGWVLHEDDTVGNTHFIVDSINLTSGVVYEFTADLKAINRSWALLFNTGENDGYYFNVSTGVAGSALNNVNDYSILSLGDDWYRCRIVIPATATGARPFAVYIAEADNDATFNGLDQDSLYIANASVKTWERKLYSVGAGLPRQCLRQEATSKADFGGYLPESAMTNLCTHSQELDNAAWTKTRVTIDADSVAAPDGTTTADTIQEDGTANETHFLTDTFVGAGSTAYFYCVWLKAAQRTWGNLLFWSPTDGTSGCYFDLATGATGTASNLDAYGIEDWGNGWFLCWAKDTRATAENQTVYIRVAEGDNDATFDGLSQDSIYAWGAMIIANVDSPPSYIYTSGATATRNADVLYYAGDDGNLGGVGSYKRLTMAAEVLRPNENNTRLYPGFLEVSDGGSNNDRVQLLENVASDVVYAYAVAAGSAGEINLAAGSDISDGDARSLRLTYRVGEAKLYVNGSQVDVTDEPADLPDDLDRIYVGNTQSANWQANGLIRNVRIWPYPHTHE